MFKRSLPLFSSLAVLASLALPSIAHADTPPAFGRRGDVVLSDLLGIRTGGPGYLGMMGLAYPIPGISGLIGYYRSDIVSDQSYQAGPANDTRETLSINPSLDVFVTNRVSLGVSAGFARTEEVTSFYDRTATQPREAQRTLQHALSFGVAPRVGYVVPLGHGFSLWPRVGVTYSKGKATQETVRPQYAYAGYSIAEQWSGGADVGVVFRPIEHLYLSAGPELSVAFNHYEQEQVTQYRFTSDQVNVRVAGSLSMGLIF